VHFIGFYYKNKSIDILQDHAACILGLADQKSYLIPTRLHGVRAQMTVFLTVTNIRTLNNISCQDNINLMGYDTVLLNEQLPMS
jgi:hypothetical protein